MKTFADQSNCKINKSKRKPIRNPILYLSINKMKAAKTQIPLIKPKYTNIYAYYTHFQLERATLAYFDGVRQWILPATDPATYGSKAE